MTTEEATAPAASATVDEEDEVRPESSTTEGCVQEQRQQVETTTTTITTADHHFTTGQDNDDTTTTTVPDDTTTTSSKDDDDLLPGDHVYMWRSLAGIPGMFQHHGVVLQVEEEEIVIADFTNIIRASHDDSSGQRQGTTSKLLFSVPRSNNNNKTRGGMQETRESRKEKHGWHRVEYSATFLKRSFFRRSGTCTATPSQPVGLVLARAKFLLENPDKLPPYHVFKANCECVSVWCKTGVWTTLQASSFLHMTAASQAKSASVLAAIASTQTVTVPSAGMWGWLGYTTQASLVSTQPWIIPVIAGYGVVTVGVPYAVLLTSRKFWNDTTKRLGEDFWSDAIDRPDVFVECITEWSDLVEGR